MQRLISFVLLVTLAAALSAQTAERPAAADASSIGVIVYAEGNTVTILRAGAQIALDAAFGEPLGEPVLPGDQVTTGESTYAELQLLTSRNIVKIAENTTFTVAELTSDGGSALSVTYGRIRARVERLSGNDRFELRGMTAVAGVRGTDFGYDQVLDPVTGELINRIYCFDGEVAVTRTVSAGASGVDDPEAADAGDSMIEETTIRAGEMVSARVEPVSEAQAVMTVVALEEPVREFWTARPFVREAQDAETLIREFPTLPERARDAVGVVPPVIEEAVAQAERPAVAVEAAGAAVVDASESVEEERKPDGLAEVVLGERDTPELREQISGSLRTTGYWLTGLGVAVDLAVVGLVFFGDQVPAWDTAWDPYLAPVGAAGVGIVVLGAASIVLSLAFGN